jgi:hypothetical protein
MVRGALRRFVTLGYSVSFRVIMSLASLERPVAVAYTPRVMQTIHASLAALPPSGPLRSSQLVMWLEAYEEGKPVMGLWSVLLELLTTNPTLPARDEVRLLEFVTRQLNSITHQGDLVGTVARQLRSRALEVSAAAHDAFIAAACAFLAVEVASREARVDALEALIAIAQRPTCSDAMLRGLAKQVSTGVLFPESLERRLGPRGWSRAYWFLNEYLASRGVTLSGVWRYMPGPQEETPAESPNELARRLSKTSGRSLSLGSGTFVLWNGLDGDPLASHPLGAKKVTVYSSTNDVFLFSAGPVHEWESPQTITFTGLYGSDEGLSANPRVLSTDLSGDGRPGVLLPFGGKKEQIYRVTDAQARGVVQVGRNRRNGVRALLVRIEDE